MVLFMELNWWAVVVSTVVVFGLGAVWFSPKVFGTIWMDAQPHRKPEDYQNAGLAMVVTFASSFLQALLTVVLFGYAGWVGVFLLVLVMAFSMMGGALFLGQQRGLWSVAIGYEVSQVILIGLIAHAFANFAA